MLEAELTEQLYLSICLLYLMIHTCIYILSLSDQVVQDKARLFIYDQSELISLTPGSRTTQPSPLQSGPVGVKTQPWRQAPIHLPHLNTEPPHVPCWLFLQAAHYKVITKLLCSEPEDCG